MESNPYAAPDSVLAIEAVPVRRRFYVVSALKFFVLFFMTLGAYQLYWHYMNWSLYKQATRGDQSPVMRSLFSVFFTHALFAEIDKELVMTGRQHPWSPRLNATVIVVLIIGTQIVDRVAAASEELTWWDSVGFLAIPVSAYFFYQAQKAVNAACGDPDGHGNANFTIANIIWIVLGGLLWLLVAAGTAALMLPE